MANGIKYTAKAISYDWGTSKNKGTPFVSVVFEVSEADTKAPGAQFNWEGYFTEATTDRTFKSLRYCGCTFPGNDATNLEGLTRNAVKITVEETDFGPRVAWVDPVGNVNDENRMAGGSLKAFASQMKGALLASAKGATAPRAPAAPTGPAPFDANEQPWDGQGAEPGGEGPALGPNGAPF